MLKQAEAICNYMPGYIEFRSGSRTKGEVHEICRGCNAENDAEDITVRERVNQIRNEINDSKRDQKTHSNS